DSAQIIAETPQLDFLEFTDDQGRIISSAQWPAKFGYKDPIAKPNTPANPFLKEEETPAGPQLGLFVVRSISAGDRKLYVVGGIRQDKYFLASIDLPAGKRVMLYENLDGGGLTPPQLIAADGPVQDPQPLAPIVQQVQRDLRESAATVHWKSGDDETINAIP